MDRVYLDANVLFSAAYAEGSGLARLWRWKSVRLLASEYVIEEAHRNSEPEAQARLVKLLVRVERVGDPAEALDPESEEPLPADDRPVLRAAMAAGATHLLTGDRRAFGPLYGRRAGGVLILRPAEYLATRHRAKR